MAGSRNKGHNVLAGSAAPLTRLTPSTSLSGRELDPIDDYVQLANGFDWGRMLGEVASLTPARVLDVGSGTGRFLRVLTAVWPEINALRDRLRYTALDPVSDAAEEASRVAEYFSTPTPPVVESIQHIDPLQMESFEVIWAIHSLYSLTPDDVGPAVSAMVSLLAPDGFGVVALGDHSSFYAEAYPTMTGRPRFCLAEDIAEALETQDVSIAIDVVSYTESIPAHDTKGLARYLWHESIGNTYIPAGGTGEHGLPALPTSSWWEGFRHGDMFEFPQTTQVLQFWRTGDGNPVGDTGIEPVTSSV